MSVDVEEPYEPLNLKISSKVKTKEAAILMLGSVIKTIRKLPEDNTLQITVSVKELQQKKRKGDDES